MISDVISLILLIASGIVTVLAAIGLVGLVLYRPVSWLLPLLLCRVGLHLHPVVHGQDAKWQPLLNCPRCGAVWVGTLEEARLAEGGLYFDRRRSQALYRLAMQQHPEILEDVQNRVEEDATNPYL